MARKKLTAAALTGVLAATLAPAAALPGGGDGIRYNSDGTIRCVENGWKFSDPSGYAPAPHCFATEPDGGVESLPAPLAEVNEALTKDDLTKVEDTSALNPNNLLGKGTFAYQALTGNEPISPLSKQITANFQQSNYAFNHWSTGMNAGWGYAANENIPIYSVDSANPHQNYIWVESTDSRATTIPGYKELMAGKIPFPDWAMKDYGWSRDKSVAIYDTSTGIWRSMFYFVPITETNEAGEKVQAYTEDGLPRYKYASGGYIVGKKNFEGLGEENYWLTLMGGTSSVVGMANELTQIGVDEIRAGEINHAISITVADYAGSSFPAKMSDGRINQIRAEGSKELEGAVGQRFRVSKFSSGKIDEGLNNKYRTSLEVLRDNKIIDLAHDYTVTRNDLITADTDVEALAKEQGWNNTIKNHAATFKNYLAEGDMLTVTGEPLPYAPKAGDRATIPAHVDVELLADKYSLSSEFDRMLLRTIQKRGLYLTDRNAFVHALNLEPAASYAPYARLGLNVYKEDPEIVEAMAGSNSHAFPWQELVWIDSGYVGVEGDDGVKNTSEQYVMDVKEGENPTIYVPDSYNEQTYVGQAVYENIHEQAIFPAGVAFHAPWFNAVKHEEGGTISNRHDKSWEFNPTLRTAANPAEAVLSSINVVGYVKTGTNNYLDASQYDLHKASVGKTNLLKIAQQAPLQAAYKNTWNVTTVDRDQPIARTDIVKLAKGQTVTADVMGNDEAYFGAKAGMRASEQYDRSWGSVSLLNESGEEVSEVESGGLKYRVTEDNLIEVEAVEAVEGIAPLVRYVVKVEGGLAADATPGAVSAPGVIQAHVYSRVAAAVEEPVVDPAPVDPEPEPTPDPTPVEPEPAPEPSTPAAPEPQPSDPVVPEPAPEETVTPTPDPTVEPTVPEPTPEPSPEESTPAPEEPVVPEPEVTVEPTPVPDTETEPEPTSTAPAPEPSPSPSTATEGSTEREEEVNSENGTQQPSEEPVATQEASTQPETQEGGIKAPRGDSSPLGEAGKKNLEESPAPETHNKSQTPSKELTNQPENNTTNPSPGVLANTGAKLGVLLAAAIALLSAGTVFLLRTRREKQ